MVLETQDFVYDPTKRFAIPDDARLFNDIYSLVKEDKWAFIVIWGEQRTGKSTLGLWCAYFLWRQLCPDLSEDELWQRVYASIIFNLTSLIYKMDDPKQERVWDWNRMHYRIPIAFWDDFGARPNQFICVPRPNQFI